MKRPILLGVVLLLMLPTLVYAAGRALKGQVLLVGPHDQATPAVGVDVTLRETGDSVRTKAQGLFRLFLPEAFKAGERVTLLVDKKDRVIQHPMDGEARIPAQLEKEVVEVHLLPKGSKKLWSDERIEKFIQDTAEKAKQEVKLEGKPEKIDFSRYIKDWATGLGFRVHEAQAEIDTWVAEVEQRQDGHGHRFVRLIDSTMA